MGKLSFLQIELNKSVYVSGETVTGSVSIGVVDRIKIRSVKFEMHGEAYVHWSESRGTGDQRRTHNYTDRENYIDLSLFFVNQQNSGDNYLEVGEYKYPFQLALPPVLPSSLEVTHGYVRYWTIARVDIPWAIDKYARMAFTVINMMDLNTMPPAIRMPVGISNNTQVGCCSKGMIEYKLSIPKAGYVPGEGVRFTVNIDNRSVFRCTNVRVRLTKRVTLTAQGQKNKSETVVLEVLMPNHIISPNTCDKWDGILVVPPVVSSIPYNVCRIIEIDYTFSLKFNSGTLGLGYGIDVPIIIGYVPLKEAVNDAEYSMSDFAFHPSPLNPVTKMAHKDENEAGHSMQSNHSSYQPMYPFYQSLTPATPPTDPPPYTETEPDKN